MRPDERARYGLPPIEWYVSSCLAGHVMLRKGGLTIAPDVWAQWPSRAEHLQVGYVPEQHVLVLAGGGRLRVRETSRGYTVSQASLGRWLAAHHLMPGHYPVRIEDDWLVVLCGPTRSDAPDLAEEEKGR